MNFRIKSQRKGYDPRVYQIAVLMSIMGYGMFFLDFEIYLGHVAVILSSVLVTQYVFTKWVRLPHFDPRSPLISGLSLCLLLRTNSVLLAAAAAIVTIASKFSLRFNGKHVYNPTNFGLVVMMLITDKVWVSPGQWGSAAFFGFLLACVGGLVVNRASRSDITLAFLGFYVIFIFGRALWLGDPLAIPFHQIRNGTFLIFTFFMISDPKTTPDSRVGRILFALLVACGAFFIQFGLYRPNGVLWSLAVFSIITPFIDRFFPESRYVWKQPTTNLITQGVTNEEIVHTSSAIPVCGPTR